MDTRRTAIALLGQGRSLNSVSKELGVSRWCLREWRDHGTSPKPRSRSCPVCGPDPLLDEKAYVALFGFYLGDGCLSIQRSTCSLRISCDAAYPGIIADVTHLVEVVRQDGPACHVAAPGQVVVQKWWKHWPCLFPQHGPGHKHERQLELTDWQRELIERHPWDFLRGLFHSDGCRVNNWATRTVAGEKKRYEYGRWQFTNHSLEIQQWCKNTLDQVGIPWRQSSWKVVSISRKAGVAQLDGLLGRKL